MDKLNPDYITVEDFAKQMKVPIEAVMHAIEMNKLPADNTIVAGYTVIPVGQLQSYEFELIPVYEYAKRRKVSYRAVYNKAYSGQIKYTLDESDLMKIDWKLFSDVHFRVNTFKHRKTINTHIGYINDAQSHNTPTD